MYTNIEEFVEYGEDEAYARHDDEATPESEAFIARYLSDLGLAKPPNLPRSKSKKNPSWNYYTDANITLYTSQIEEFDEEGYGQGGDEGYAHYDDELTSESEALITQHLSDLGLIKSPNPPQSRSKNNSSLNFYTDAYITFEDNEEEEEEGDDNDDDAGSDVYDD